MSTREIYANEILNDADSGKVLTFNLNENVYGIPILKVSEIIGLIQITPIPKTPDFMKGVINLRGKIIPVIDLRLKFDLPEKVYDKNTCIIIINVECQNIEKQVGVVVDIVSEVCDINSSDIEVPPNCSTSDDANFLSGIGKIKDKVIMLLDIDKVVKDRAIMDFVAMDKSVENKGVSNGMV